MVAAFCHTAWLTSLWLHRLLRLQIGSRLRTNEIIILEPMVAKKETRAQSGVFPPSYRGGGGLEHSGTLSMSANVRDERVFIEVWHQAYKWLDQVGA